MENSIKKIANPHIVDLIPYQPGKPIEELARQLGISDIIKLASNENPLGASEKAMLAAKKALETLYLYPDGACFELKEALSRFHHLPFNHFTIGNGSENILEIIVKSFLMPGEEAIISQYTFATIPLILKSFGANIVTIPTQAWQVDCKAILNTLHAKVKMIFIVNPNTGTYVSKSNLELILEKASPETIIVVDEAYNEYIDAEDYTDALPYIEQYPNLIVVRTFSKAYGLSGLRVGYAISQAQVADILNRTRLPFNVNSIALAAATASLNDQAHVEKSKALNDRGKKKLTEGFKKLNLNFIPSVANFVTVHVGEKALDIYEKLLQKGVIVRPLVGYGMGEFLRITIGTEKENARLLSALGEVK